MNKGLKKIAFLTGLGILFVSIYWSQDGFNFDIAGSAGYGKVAVFIGWFLAIAVSVFQFVFSSNFRELNMSLIVIGAIAYWYSIDTNVSGILHFMGSQQDVWWARGLGFLMDASAEPIIAWSLGVSREGDFLGNIVKTVVAFFNNMFDGAKGSEKPQTHTPKREKQESSENESIPVDFPFVNRRNEQKQRKHADMRKLHGVNSKPREEKPHFRTYFDE